MTTLSDLVVRIPCPRCGAMAGAVCTYDGKQAAYHTARIEPIHRAFRLGQAIAWDEGYQVRATTLGMTQDPNPYRGTP